MNSSILTLAHIVQENPIIFDSNKNKERYLELLKGYIRIGGWTRRKWIVAELSAYEKILYEDRGGTVVEHDFGYYKYYTLFDLMHVIGYDEEQLHDPSMSEIIDKYKSDFSLSETQLKTVYQIIGCMNDIPGKYRELLKNRNLVNEKKYITLIADNYIFMKQEPFYILVTATMSAGKSTFINALVGKNVSLSQNMACTSKIHHVISKRYEDGYSSEYDHDLVLTAGKEELLNDNENNNSNRIVVSTCFNGELKGKRIVIQDSPGVNFSGAEEHKDISNRRIRGKDYDLLVYLMNATNLSSNDEAEHLKYVKSVVGRKQTIFIINKIDEFHLEEESVEEAIARQREVLIAQGFKNPIICPVSAKAAVLSKMYEQEMEIRTGFGKRELYTCVDKFMEMNLGQYYKEVFPEIDVPDNEVEEIQLYKTCGMAYVEKIIKKYITRREL